MTDPGTLSSRQRREVLVLMCLALAVVIAATIYLNIAQPSFASDAGPSADADQPPVLAVGSWVLGHRRRVGDAAHSGHVDDARPAGPAAGCSIGMRAVVATGCLFVAASLLILAQLQVDSSYLHFLVGTFALGTVIALSAARRPRRSGLASRARSRASPRRSTTPRASWVGRWASPCWAAFSTRATAAPSTAPSQTSTGYATRRAPLSSPPCRPQPTSAHAASG